MPTEKDYCDYDTCVALKKLGYKEKTLAYYTSEGFFHWRRAYIYDAAIPDLAKSSNKELYKHVLDAVSLYEAQEFLREEKGINIFVMQITIEGSGMHRYASYIQSGDRIWICRYYSLYEEALIEGLRTSIKILQDEQKENN